VRTLGVNVARPEKDGDPGGWTLVSLDAGGTVEEVRRPSSLPELVASVAAITGDEPFLLGIDVPVAGVSKSSRPRAVDSLVRRRLGLRLSPGARAGRPAFHGETLLAALASAGHPCLTYPDRNRRTSGLAEIHPALVLKSLLWDGSPLRRTGPQERREEAFLAYAPPAFRRGTGRSRAGWAERLASLDVALRAVGDPPGYDLATVRDAVEQVAGDDDLARAVSLLDAILIAGTGRRYLDSPEECLFVGERETGYTILPADSFVRRTVLQDARPSAVRLFPKASLADRLRDVADIRPLDLLPVRGRAQRHEAVFREPPLLEFDNLDEMMWWKHCRHLAGPPLPTEGLVELVVALETDGDKPLRLVRSRHRTLSFRFDPPAAWRARLATRDGKTYPFRVLRATYETKASA
jgi:predicted RNase H-like nuclease